MAAARYIGNIYSDPDGSKGPFTMLGLFQAGATAAIAEGDLLEMTADTATRWVPMDLDYGMAADVAIAVERVRSGDRAGYYKIAVPRDGDMWRFPLAAAGATAIGTALYWSAKNVVTVSAGTNIIGNAIGQDHYPQKQGHLSDDAGPDMGETIKSQASVTFTIQTSNSYLAALQTA